MTLASIPASRLWTYYSLHGADPRYRQEGDMERESFDWSDTARQAVQDWCLAHDHPAGTVYQRVYDYNGGIQGVTSEGEAIRLKFMSRSCDCGARLYLDSPELKVVKKVGLQHMVTVGTGNEDDPSVDHQVPEDPSPFDG
jgi:hypothetical protein